MRCVRFFHEGELLGGGGDGGDVIDLPNTCLIDITRPMHFLTYISFYILLLIS